MDNRERMQRKQRSNTIWTLLIIGAFLLAWPLGIILSILKSKNILPDLAMDLPSAEQRKQQTTYSASAPHEYNPASRDYAQQAREQAERAKQQAQYWARQAQEQAERSRQRSVQWAVPVQQKKQAPPQPQRAAAPKPKKADKSRAEKLKFGKPMFITGLCIGGVGLLTLADSLSEVFSLRDLLREGFFPLGILAVGIYLTIYGLLRAKQSRRLQEYASILPPNGTYYSIHELSDRTGRPFRQVLADLQKMVDLGVWEQAWIDRKHGRLMFTEYSAEQLVQEKQPETKPPEQNDGRAEQVLRRIRRDNDRIADEAISRKIDRIELLTGEIFRYLSKHPEREGELRSFMDYYLPQTLKILETYAQLEEQGVETDNIRRAKGQISEMLDQLTESYERQLDKLFDTDVLDISSDIEVMRQMLRNDGLSADELELTLEHLERQ